MSEAALNRLILTLTRGLNAGTVHINGSLLVEVGRRPEDQRMIEIHVVNHELIVEEI